MLDALKDNPSLNRYAVWIAGLGLVGLASAFLLFFCIQDPTFTLLLCQFSLVPTIALAWIERSAYRTARQLYTNKRLDRQAVTSLVAEVLLVSGLVVAAGFLAAFKGSIARSDLSAVNVSLALLSSSLGIVCLFFPVQVLSLGLGAWAFYRLHQLPPEAFHSELPTADEVESDLSLDATDATSGSF